MDIGESKLMHSLAPFLLPHPDLHMQTINLAAYSLASHYAVAYNLIPYIISVPRS
jgi:hypothetical protein